MSRNKKAVGLLSALIVTLAILPVLNQPSSQRSGLDDQATVQLIFLAGLYLEGEGGNGESFMEQGTIGGVLGAMAAGLSEAGEVFGWFGKAFARRLASASLITMGLAG